MYKGAAAALVVGLRHAAAADSDAGIPEGVRVLVREVGPRLGFGGGGAVGVELRL